MNLSTLTSGLKETAVGEFGKWLVDKWGVGSQAVMDACKVDSENKILDITLKRKDQEEEEPMNLKIRYSLETQDGKDVLILTPVEASGEWIKKLIENENVKSYFDRPIELPAIAAAAAKHLL